VTEEAERSWALLAALLGATIPDLSLALTTPRPTSIAPVPVS
jgi:hypothetical protein